MTDQAEAVGVQRLRFVWFLGRHCNVPALKFCYHLCCTEDDCWVGTATVNELHQTLLIMQPARTDRWRLNTGSGEVGSYCYWEHWSYWQYPLYSGSTGRPQGSSHLLPSSLSSKTKHNPENKPAYEPNRKSGFT